MKQKQNGWFTKVAGLCGIIGPVIALTSISLAILYAPWFSWTKNALSDLGVYGISAVIFNFGLIICGIATAIFGIGVKEILPKRILSRIGRITLTLDCIDLCAIGIFPETAGIIHFYVSVVFFVLLSISLILLGADGLREQPRRKEGIYMILSGILAGAVWLFPWEGVAIPEIIAALTISLWSIILGFRLFRSMPS